MFPPFPEENAFEICKKIVDFLNLNKLKIEQTSQESLERKNQGIMIGVLICENQQKEQKILYSTSGISKIIKKTDNFTDSDSINFSAEFIYPVVSQEKINSALLKNDKKIHELTEKIQNLSKINSDSEEIKNLKNYRKKLCNESLKNVYDLYKFHCSDGSIKSLNQICKNKLPPTGTGDCAEIKLLNYAFKNKLIPISMCQIFYDSKTNSKNLQKYSPCDERCRLLLPEILGLEIIYQDKNLIVVNKQSGLLSVPGRTPEKQDCIVNRLKKLFPDTINQPSVHRLDMETSGLMVLAFDSETHKNLNKQFENREVKKEYIAVLEGIVKKSDLPETEYLKWTSDKSGILELFFRLDIENRPHQIWDKENGKSAITEFEIINYENYINPQNKKIKTTRIRFIPHTGRTHQLRLASSNIHGLNHQIIGDTLYGICNPGERLLLHAQYLSFIHPISGERMEFILPPTF